MPRPAVEEQKRFLGKQSGEGASGWPPLAEYSGKPRRWPWQGHLRLLLVGTAQKGGERRADACPEAFEMVSPWTKEVSIPLIVFSSTASFCSSRETTLTPLEEQTDSESSRKCKVNLLNQQKSVLSEALGLFCGSQRYRRYL